MPKVKFFLLLFFICSICHAQPDYIQPPLEITEEDGSPSTYPYKLKFPNTSLTDNGDETASLSFDLLYPLRTEWLQNGFPNLTDSTLSFAVTGTPAGTFSIQPTGDSFDYFDDGVKYTSTGDTIAIADTEGLHLFYYSDDTLTTIANATDAQIETATLSDCLIAYIYWDADNNLSELMEDRHGIIMSPVTHRELHFTAGTTFFDGLALGDFSVDGNGSLDAHAQFSVATGQIFDEDIKHTLNTIGSTTGLEVWYRNASLDWRKDTQAGFSVLNAASGRVQYDNAGTLTEVTDAKFVLYHIFATSNSDLNPIVIMGQAEYATQKLARQGATTEINSIFLGSLPAKEMKTIATVIFQTKDTYSNSVKARIRTTDEGDNYVDWRTAEISPSAPAIDHGSLSGLGDDDHIQYLLADGSRPLTSAWAASNDITEVSTLDTADLTISDTFITVDTEAGIQVAIDALEAAGGGTVHISAGLYYGSWTLEGPNIIIEGEGMDTVLRQPDSADVDVITVNGASTIHWEIRDLQIDGIRVNNTAGSGIRITTACGDSWAKISRVHIESCDENGIEIDDVDVRGIVFNDVWVYTTDEHGFLLNGSDHKLVNCVAGSCGFNGFYVSAGVDQFVNCKAFYCGDSSSDPTFYAGFEIDGFGHEKFVNCLAQDNKCDGFKIDAPNVSLVGCFATGNHRVVAPGSQIAGTFAGIRTTSSGDYATITGTDSGRNPGLGNESQKYGLIVESGAIGCNIVGNTFEGNVTGKISIGATELANNTLVNDSDTALYVTTPTGEVLIFDADLNISDAHPHITQRDSDTDDAIQHHFDMDDQTWGIHQLWRGTDTDGVSFAVNPDNPIWYMDTNNALNYLYDMKFIGNEVGGAKHFLFDVSDNSGLFAGTTKLYFGAVADDTYIYQSIGGVTPQLDIVSDDFVKIAAEHIWLYRDDANTFGAGSQLQLEQDGVGDANIRYLLTGGQEYREGIDNSAADAYELYDVTNSKQFFKYVPSSADTTIGVAGANIILGDGSAISVLSGGDNTTVFGSAINGWKGGFFTDIVVMEKGLNTMYSEQNNASATIPTDAELNSAFGTPEALGPSFVGGLDENSADTNMFICITSDGSWYYLKFTKAL